MKTKISKMPCNGWLTLAALILPWATPGMAQMGGGVHLVDGIPGPNFTLTAKDGYISAGDGNSLYFWGYANGAGPAQYVGPTLIVNQGQVVTVTLNNELPVPTSIVFPGQMVTNSGGVVGLLAKEATPGDSVTYGFVATEPGSYTYYSGTQPDLQVEMGLVGALIVRPTGWDPMTFEGRRAYYHPDSSFDQEFLFLLTEMDEYIHDLVEYQVLFGDPIAVDTTERWPVYWFINGRTGPDTMLPAFAEWLPSQPYDCMPMCHPGEKLLMRVIGGGRDAHPLHHHGNHSLIIARDGRLLESAPSAGADLANLVYTIASTPGGTIDALFSWTGEKLGWDPYGHQPGDPPAPYEYLADHGKPIPTKLPLDQDLTFGQMYGGSPFLGSSGILPPGEGGYNPNNAFSYMWHSHNEKEIVNNNLFPGGMLTMAMVEAWTPLTVTPSSLPEGAVGAAYSMPDTTAVTLNLTEVGGLPATGAPPTGAGWTAPFTWSVAPGSAPLPDGLTLSADGTLSGTPTAPGTYTFTVIVTDSSMAMKKGAKALTIVVN